MKRNIFAGKRHSGGLGLNLFTNDELEEKVLEGRREAQAAFGNGEGYLERLVGRARHVEVQILGDSHGEIYHLYERDCSVQRRNQKVVERAPAPYLSEEQRTEICALGRKICAHVGYECAGTDQAKGGWKVWIKTTLALQMVLK